MSHGPTKGRAFSGRELRRHNARQKRQPPRPAASQPHPVITEIVRARIAHDIQALVRSASLHAWTGQHTANIANQAGSLVYIVCHACGTAGIHEDPDLNIVRGCASALGDLTAHPEQIETHRGAIQSGMAACARLLPHLSEIDLAFAAQTLDQLLRSTQGMGTADVERVLQRRLEGHPA